MDWREEKLRIGKGKDGKPRYAPLLPGAMKILRQMKAQFCPQPGERLFAMSENAVDMIWKAVKKECRIVDLHWHDLRHEGCSQAAALLDFDIALLQKVSGHKSLSQLRRYVNYSVREVHAKLARKRALARKPVPVAPVMAVDEDALAAKVAAQVAATLAMLGIRLPGAAAGPLGTTAEEDNRGEPSDMSGQPLRPPPRPRAH